MSAPQVCIGPHLPGVDVPETRPPLHPEGRPPHTLVIDDDLEAFGRFNWQCSQNRLDQTILTERWIPQLDVRNYVNHAYHFVPISLAKPIGLRNLSQRQLPRASQSNLGSVDQWEELRTQIIDRG